MNRHHARPNSTILRGAAALLLWGAVMVATAVPTWAAEGSVGRPVARPLEHVSERAAAYPLKHVSERAVAYPLKHVSERAVAHPVAYPVAHPVERVVSLNLCTDQMLVLLAPRKVAALSPLARDPVLSFVAGEAALLPVVRSSAEAVLRLHPDLVLGGRFGAQTTLALLEQEGVPVWRLDMPQSFAAIRAQTASLATRLDVPARGAALIAAMDATLAAIRPPAHRVIALVWEPHGYTAGPGTLMDAVLRAAGLTDAGNGRPVGLEALLRHPPDLLVVPQPPATASLATDMLESPALAGIPRRTLPPSLTICGGPFSAQAASMLAQ